MDARPLVITDNDDLLDDLLRVAAAAGVEMHARQVAGLAARLAGGIGGPAGREAGPGSGTGRAAAPVRRHRGRRRRAGRQRLGALRASRGGADGRAAARRRTSLSPSWPTACTGAGRRPGDRGDRRPGRCGRLGARRRGRGRRSRDAGVRCAARRLRPLGCRPGPADGPGGRSRTALDRPGGAAGRVPADALHQSLPSIGGPRSARRPLGTGGSGPGGRGPLGAVVRPRRHRRRRARRRNR